jgi:hypothetical protein
MKMINNSLFLLFISTLMVLFSMNAVNADKETPNLRSRNMQSCPKGRGFNYASTVPFCKISYKCALAKKEFSTQCGCGCQPIKCKDDAGCPANTHACVKGACFRKNYNN